MDGLPTVPAKPGYVFEQVNAGAIPGWVVHAGNGGSIAGSNNGGTQDYSLQLWQDNFVLEANQLYLVTTPIRAEGNRTFKLIVRPTWSATNFLDHAFELTSGFG